MKTREYFVEKLESLKIELKAEIKNQLYSIFKKDEIFYNYDESNYINFENNITEMQDNGIIDSIEICEHNIVIYPSDQDLEPIDLEDIEDVHDLMLLHYIILNYN